MSVSESVRTRLDCEELLGELDCQYRNATRPSSHLDQLTEWVLHAQEVVDSAAFGLSPGEASELLACYAAQLHSALCAIPSLGAPGNGAAPIKPLHLDTDTEQAIRRVGESHGKQLRTQWLADMHSKAAQAARVH